MPATGTSCVVRPCLPEDLDAIDAVYNHYVRTSHATFDLQEPTPQWRREWFHAHPGGRHRALVAIDGERLAGFASSSRHRPKAAYETSVETSVYVAPECVGRGVGRALYRTLLESLHGQDVHRALAGIALPNGASVDLHESLGFRRIGVFTEQGRKFGRYWDVAWYERRID
ncbi:MAG TPA: GNAT family N-acetyltransferase [Actinomycetota bacterium]